MGVAGRRVLLFSALLVAGIVAVALATAAWAENEFTQAESIVAAQSTMLARDGTLYYRLDDYPYTVCAYMPAYYLLEAGLHKAGLPARTAGRLISFASLLTLLLLVWRTVLLYTSDERYGWLAVTLAGTTALLLLWGTVGQVDMLAVMMAQAAFYFFSRYWVKGEARLATAGALAVAAMFVKQTTVAAPAAMFLLLLVRDPRTALQFGAAVGGSALALFAGINALLNGRFVLNTVLTNINPFVVEKLLNQLTYLGVACGILLFVATLGVRAARTRGIAAPFVYLGIALSVLLVTCAKLGSDSNYQLESTVLAIVCACVALHALEFFPRVLSGSKHWVTLLPAAIAMQLVIGLGMSGMMLAGRAGRERAFEAQAAALRPYVEVNGRVISTEVNAAYKSRGSLDHEPLIYTLLVAAGRIAPDRVQNDLSAGRISTVVLYEDVFGGASGFDPEIPSLPPAHLEAIRKRYQLVAHVPGPRLRGVFVYQPRLPEAASLGSHNTSAAPSRWFAQRLQTNSASLSRLR